ncbi:MAG: penicillin acylase family protein, partial [Vicinamibacteria bacterium]
VSTEDYPYYLSHLFEPPFRARRIREVIDSKEKHTIEDMKALQMDVVSIQAREFIHEVIRPLVAGGRSLHEGIDAAVRRLLVWDGNSTAGSVPAAIYHVLFQTLMQSLLQSRLGDDLYLAFAELQNQAVVPLDHLIRDPNSPWLTTAGGGEAVVQALEDTVDWLRRTLGENPNDWTWGRLHTVEMRHPLGGVPAIAPVLNIGPLRTGGDGLPVNKGFYFYSRPYRCVLGPSYRQIVDLGNPDRSLWITTSGQSGNPVSPTYRDRTPLWHRGEYLPMRADPAAIDGTVETVLIPG